MADLPTEEIPFIFHQIKLADVPAEDGRFFHGMVARFPQGRDESDDGIDAVAPVDASDNGNSAVTHVLYEDVFIL